MYADDAHLTYASKDPDELFTFLTRDLGNLKQWVDSNHLSLSIVKTKCLFKSLRLGTKSLNYLVTQMFVLMAIQ